MSTVIVKLDLVRNPKCVDRAPFVMVYDVKGKRFKLVRSIVPDYVKGKYVGGTYEFEVGTYVAYREILSSWRNSYHRYVLAKVKEDGLETIATVDVINGNVKYVEGISKVLLIEGKKLARGTRANYIVEAFRLLINDLEGSK